MTKRSNWFAALSLAFAPLLAHADAVTYDFTGSVISATGIYASVGGPLSGSYTIDLGAANPTQSSLVSTTNQWTIQTYGGAVYGVSAPPLPTSLVFSSTLTGAGLSYSTPAVGDAGELSSVNGLACTPLASSGYSYTTCKTVFGSPNAYLANETHFYTTNGSNISSRLLLYGMGPTAPFSATGLPAFSLAQYASGTLTYDDSAGNGSQLIYSITSINGVPFTPVPLPASASLALAGIGCVGGVGLLTRRRRQLAMIRP